MAATPLHKAMEYDTALDGGAPPKRKDHQHQRHLLFATLLQESQHILSFVKFH
ncbi:hypothetical protein Sjap_009240 [Stephania japonica]|uniref:Uncharacterized protein n=1 Tax=Stephania japonica TaxID=461633 RepID=A0AAP0JRR2_9MAGN